MAKRGRKPKTTVDVISVKVDHAKLLKQFEEEQRLQTEALYKDLAKLKYQVDEALSKVGHIDDSETVADAAFKAGRAYGFLDEANDRLEEMLEHIFESHDFDHWDDIVNN